MVNSSAKWETINGCLCVRQPDGTLEIPTADEIYRIAVEREQSENLPPLDSDGTTGGKKMAKTYSPVTHYSI